MRRLIPYILLILIVVGIVVGGPILLHQDQYRLRISEVLSQKLNHKVIVGKLDAGLFPPALKLRDVVLMNPAADSALFQVGEITMSLDLSSLFHLSLVPQSLSFHGWTAIIHRKLDGGWDWAEWLGPATQLHEQAAWPVSTVSLDRGELHAIDPYGPQREEFVVQVLQSQWDRGRQYISVNGVLTSLPAPVSFLFQGSGRFASNAQWTGVLDLTDENREWKLDCKVNDSHTEVSGQSAQWRFDTAYTMLRFYGRLPVSPPVPSPSTFLKQWDTHFDWQGSSLTFSQNANLEDGRSEAKGEVDYEPGRSHARVDLAIQNVKVQALESVLWGSAPLEGTSTGLTHLDVALSSNPWNSLVGQGALEVKDGRYLWPKASTDALSKAHMMRYLLKKYPDFAQSGMPLTKMSIHWQARNGVFNLDNGFCNLGDIQAGLVGKYDAARQGIDAYVRVQVHEHDKDLLKEIPPSYLTGSVIQPMHGHLQGTPGEWHLRAVRVSKIPPALLNKLSKAVKGK
jgi:hypothetical protein